MWQTSARSSFRKNGMRFDARALVSHEISFHATSEFVMNYDLLSYAASATYRPEDTPGLIGFLNGDSLVIGPELGVHPVNNSGPLSPGDYTYSVSMLALSNTYQTATTQGIFHLSYSFSEPVSFARGVLQSTPILPDSPGAFLAAPSGAWFDPPATSGFDFAMTGASLFTDILGFPTGIDADGAFEVWVGALSLGTFNVGDGVNFVDLVGNGVSSFRITGINPAVDGGDPLAFPIQLAFDTATADFTMTPIEAIPEPASLSLLGIGAIGLLRRRRD